MQQTNIHAMLRVKERSILIHHFSALDKHFILTDSINAEKYFHFI